MLCFEYDAMVLVFCLVLSFFLRARVNRNDGGLPLFRNLLLPTYAVLSMKF